MSAQAEKQNYHHGDLRQALIDAAFKLVCEFGAEAFTLKDASKAASVSVAAPYRHFPDKAALLFEVAEAGFRLLTDRTLAVFQDARPGSVDAMTALGQTYVQFARDFPNLFRLMFGEHEVGVDVNLSALLAGDKASGGIAGLLEIDTDNMEHFAFRDHAPNEGLRGYAVILKNVAKMLAENGKDVNETLSIATQLWATVHGTACLFIDKNFQNLIPDISSDDLVASASHYYLNGLLKSKEA